MLALFTELDILLNLVCIGTLFVFYMVANAVVYRRYVGSVSEPAARGSCGAGASPATRSLRRSTITRRMVERSFASSTPSVWPAPL